MGFWQLCQLERARKLTTGYDSDLIVEKVKNAALKVKTAKFLMKETRFYSTKLIILGHCSLPCFGLPDKTIINFI